MRTLLSYLVDVGVSLGTAATVAGLLAPWWPAVELVNHFRPFLALGAGLLFALSLRLRSRRLIASSAVLLAVTLALLIAPALLYGAPVDPTAERSLRVATLNTWVAKGQADRIRDFIKQSDADVVLLQEVGRGDHAALLDEITPAYPHVLLDPRSRSGPALLSKEPWIDAGIIPNGRGRPLAVWARFEQNGKTFEIASVHTANPFEWHDQPSDIDRLIDFVRTRTVSVILGGDLNLTPFSWKLAKLAQLTGMRWAQTFAASWPGNSLIPIVLLDHILVSEGLALTHVETGPRVGSDHLPIIADLFLRAGVSSAPGQ